jgi:hypothetical protein
LKSLILSGLLISFAFMSGCITYHIVKPVNPLAGNPNKNPARVASHQPVLSWEASPDTAVTYDLIIFEGLKEESFWKGTKRSVGDQVYYREGIRANTHTVETVLKPNTEYYWSVRIRKSNEISEWSRYDYSLWLITSYMRVNDTFFRFRTPDVKYQ